MCFKMGFYGYISRRLTHMARIVARTGCLRVFAPCFYAARHRAGGSLFLIITTVALLVIVGVMHSNKLAKELLMERKLIAVQAHLEHLQMLYRARHEDVITLELKLMENGRGKLGNMQLDTIEHPPTLLPEVVALVKNLTGTKSATGVSPNRLDLFHTPFSLQLLPHLMVDPYSLWPAYHMRGGRQFVDIVLGIPTVKRDKESYLLVTLKHLLDGLTPADLNSTLIVVYVGETDLEFVVNTARQIETLFLNEVKSGLIEVISPSPSFYPDFNLLPPTLGDSVKRFKWRTKQNLDTLYLMAYGQTRGTYYLMLEDDVIAKKNYIKTIKDFTSAITISNPHWFFIDYAHIGGIGKLFRSKDLLQFCMYIQLFYTNLPIDWLLESYLADRVCSDEKFSKNCGKTKNQIRPVFSKSLFQHIGLYSSLKGKIQKIKDTQFGAVPTFYPHVNPTAEKIWTDIEEHSNHVLVKAYNGQTYFWGIKPKQGSVAEFWFQKPEFIEKFTFRSGNVEHVSDRFYDTVVEVLPAAGGNFTKVGTFDEFGLAEGQPAKEFGPISAIRLKVLRDSTYWAILSEVEIKVSETKTAR